MEIFLQIWGGVFYLFAKIFLYKAEGEEPHSRLRLYGWIIYLIGVPAWIIILFLNKNWIAMSVEAGGIPAIIFGIMLSTTLFKQFPNHCKYFCKNIYNGNGCLRNHV